MMLRVHIDILFPPLFLTALFYTNFARPCEGVKGLLSVSDNNGSSQEPSLMELFSLLISFSCLTLQEVVLSCMTVY